MQNFLKIRSVEAKLFHADRQTDGQTDGWADMTKPIAAFRNFFERASRSTVDKRIMFRSDLKRIQKCYPEIFMSSATVGPNVGFGC